MPEFVEIEGRKFFKRVDKSKRIFHRLITGLQIAKNQDAKMRFLTLTSTPNSPRPIKQSFDILRQRIERASWYKDGFDGFKLNRYYCLRTKEGPKGVLHVIFWGGNYIPQAWLSWNWEQIHYAFKADIRAVWTQRRRVNGLVGYLIGNLGNYLEGQPIERMSYGWKWAWLGFCKSWKHIKQTQSLLHRCGSLKDKFTWRTITKPKVIGFDEVKWREVIDYNTTVTYQVPIVSFKDHWRSAVKDYWNLLAWYPKPTTRQLFFCKKDHVTWNKKLLNP